MTKLQKKEPLEEFARKKLIARQHALVERITAGDREARELYETREIETGDQAGEVIAAKSIENVSESERAQLARVIAALARLDAGEWGRCVSCGKPIGERRLRAVPEAIRCAQCTNHHV